MATNLPWGDHYNLYMDHMLLVARQLVLAMFTMLRSPYKCKYDYNNSSMVGMQSIYSIFKLCALIPGNSRRGTAKL